MDSLPDSGFPVKTKADYPALPSHLLHEARHLARAASEDNPITEPQARPLVTSAAVYLLLDGVMTKKRHPRVIEHFGSMLHGILPLAVCAIPKGKKTPTSFDERIANWLIDKIRRSSSGWQLEVAKGTVIADSFLLTRLQELSRLKVCEEGELPAQGHSGKSILGKGRRRPPEDGETTAAAAETAGTPASASDAAAASVAATATSSSTSPKPASTPTRASLVSRQLTVSAMLNSLATAAGVDLVAHQPGRHSGGVHISSSPSRVANAVTNASAVTPLPSSPPLPMRAH